MSIIYCYCLFQTFFFFIKFYSNQTFRVHKLNNTVEFLTATDVMLRADTYVITYIFL